jgi:type I restriction enzyme S subunit
MNPERLLQHFDRIAEAPDAIPRLRRFILDLAVRGKLVEQNPKDKSALSQLALNEQARKETAQKDRRADSGSQQLLVPEEKWEVPSSWEWRAIADLVLFIDYRGKTPSKVEEGIRLITAKNVRKGFISLLPEEFLSESNYVEWMTRGIPQEGDVLFTTEAPMGNAAVVRLKERFALAQRVINFRSYGALDPDFFVLQLLAEPFQLILDKTATGLTAKGIKAAKLKRLPLAIPPLAEQHRIVAKVDELMALCDQLEAAKTEREQSRDRLVAASLHRLNSPDDTGEDDAPDAFRDHTRFYFNHLLRLTTRPEHIKQLRQTILNLAVRGKLVPQDPNDEPAAELLKRIEVEKARLVKEGKIRKQDALPLVIEDDQPFLPPDGWRWERLANVSRKIHYGFTASANTTVKTVRLLRITDIQDNSVNWDSVPGCEIADEQVDQFKLEAGDILIARTGGTIGKSFLVSQIPVTAVFASYLIRVQGSANLYDRYLKLFVESPVYWKQLEDGTRGAGQPNVNGQTLGRMAVSLPPLAEQHRIVAKVDELMALCDQLEVQLTTTEADSRRLLEAVLHEALAQD